MKSIFAKHLQPLLLAGAFIGSTLCSCENEIPYTPSLQKPQLIMNALLDAGKTHNYVYLNLSGPEEIGVVKKAAVTLYVNGQKAEEGVEIPVILPEGATEDILPPVARRKMFQLSTPLHPGDEIRIEATADNQYHTSAQTKVPQPIGAIQADTSTMTIRINGNWTPYRQYKITVNDRPNENNFYRLEINNHISTLCKYANESYPDTLITIDLNEVVNREDIVLTDGNTTTGEDQENGMFFPVIENRYNIFNDHRFKDAAHTLKVYTPTYEYTYPPFVTGHYFRKVIRNQRITVRLLSIPEEQYRYLKALNALKSSDYDSMLMEPIILPNNVKGGLGFVSACAETTYTIDLPETYGH